MALDQQLSQRPYPKAVNGNEDGANNGIAVRPPYAAAGDDLGGKASRLPRWTRAEILVLIQGKRDAENRFGRGRSDGLPIGSGHSEPKWVSVASYCRKHGVNRGPVQCRKRWSNLAGDFKKIKEWESRMREEAESFWVMRNDLRRERKLPGFFDKEVYDILNEGSPAPEPVVDDGGEGGDAEQHLNDSNRRVGGEEQEGLFSDFEKEVLALAPTKAIPVTIPISEKQYQPLLYGSQGEEGDAQGATNEKQPSSNPEMGSTSQGERKRKRFATNGEEETLQNQLIDVLERNGKMLSAQFEAQNINFRLDREQQKDNASNLVAVLDKLADALGRIADKF